MILDLLLIDLWSLLSCQPLVCCLLLIVHRWQQEQYKQGCDNQSDRGRNIVAFKMIFTIVGLLITFASICGVLSCTYFPVAVNSSFLILCRVVSFYFGAPYFYALISSDLWLYPYIVFSIEVGSVILSWAIFAQEAFPYCYICNRMIIMGCPEVTVTAANIIWASC